MTSGFEVLGIQWRYETSRALTGSSEPRQPFITGIASMGVRCHGCGTAWQAASSLNGGPGLFVVFADEIVIICEKCHRQGSVQRPFPPAKH